MRAHSIIALSVLLVLAGCTSGEKQSPASQCSDPPTDAVGALSEFDMRIEPNPVKAGAVTTLSVAHELSAHNSYWTSADASWECWSGTTWIETHILIRGFTGSTEPKVIDLEVGNDGGIPDVALPIPNSFEVLVPEVGPGTYRITDSIFGSQSTMGAHVVVEVSSG